ncbi:membrane protein [Mycoplasmopsis californica]|uniref:Membrane protein n=1 Tax=Mycoplasmopsis californica TaxID=2113 RepID=A0A059XVK3_9BACT|nr:putative immunoglobulin-blocking virulence protein [Mycoplasmopsis californica]AIA29351.1 membrane protein [Mycoplasmopsis californica]
MSFWKQKRNKIIIGAVSGTIIVSTLGATVVYTLTASVKNSLTYKTQAPASPNFIANNNLDLNSAVISNADANLREIIQSEQPKPEKPKPEIINIAPKPPEPKTEPIKVEPKKVEKVKTEKPKPKSEEKNKKITPLKHKQQPLKINKLPPVLKPAEPKKPKDEIKQKNDKKPVLPTEKPAIRVEKPKPPIPAPPVINTTPLPPANTTPSFVPAPEDVAPAPAETKIINTQIEIAGKLVNAKVQVKIQRIVSQYDIKKGIANREEYVNSSVDKIISVETTPELEKANLLIGLGDGQSNSGIRAKYIANLIADDIKNFQHQPEKFQQHIKNNWENFWQKQFDRWKLLFDSNNVVKFIKQEKLQEYQNTNWSSIEHRYLWLYHNLDWSKITELTDRAKRFLAEGFTISEENSFLTEDGKIDAWASSLPRKYNSVISRIDRDNKTKRFIDYDDGDKGPFFRSPDDIKNGIYPGWTNSNVTEEEKFKSLNIQKTDGINIIRKTRDKEEAGKINEVNVLEIDAANEDGYQKTINILKDVKKHPEWNIKSFKIFNMGKNDSSQKFKDILSELPDDIGQLELSFSDTATNTGSLIALENKNIKELSLYTLGNSLLEDWKINPLALKNTRWVNTNDYNVSHEFKKGSQIATRITFNTLSFDAGDYQPDKSDPYERINDGLRMAYWVRNNEPIFQGQYGPGKDDPDNNEHTNSYPTALDFSNIPQIKTLKGLIFKDIIKPQNGSRKITKVTFFNDKKHFELSENDLNDAGFENIVNNPPYEKGKIAFSNGNTTQEIKINSTTILSANAIHNLHKFIEFARNNNEFKGTIIIQLGADELKAQLEQAGFKVEQRDGDLEYA